MPLPLSRSSRGTFSRPSHFGYTPNKKFYLQDYTLMPVFSMGKKSIKPLPPSPTSSPKPSTSAEPPRPGTSGTELLLTTNRRTASAQYLAAQRAETAYKAKKRSASARQHRSEAKGHFKQSAFHLKEGIKSCVKMMKAVPWMVRGWKERKEAEKERKEVEKCVEKKKKLEEKIAKRENGKEGDKDKDVEKDD